MKKFLLFALIIGSILAIFFGKSIFAASQDIKIISPADGDLWEPGNTYNIIWESNGVSKVSLEIIKDDLLVTEENWEVQLDGNPGSYNLYIPSDKATGDWLIYIHSRDGGPIDSRSVYISAAGAPKIDSILSVDNLRAGDDLDFATRSANLVIAGKNFFPLYRPEFIFSSPELKVNSYRVDSDQQISLSISSVSGTDCFNFPIITLSVKINNKESNSFILPFMFRSCASSAPALSLVYPNGGEQWAAGSTHEISWNTSGSVPTVSLILWDASNYGQFIVENIENTGSYSWTVPSSLLLGQYKIKVSGNNYSDATDISDNYFSIDASDLPTKVTGFATLSSSSSGNSVRLIWMASQSATGIGVYNIYRGTTPGFTSVASNLIAQANANSYTDRNLPLGIYYYKIAAQDIRGNIGPVSDEIRIDASNTSAFDIISPNGGEKLVRGAFYTVNWSVYGLNSVNLLLYKGNNCSFSSITGKQVCGMIGEGSGVSIEQARIALNIPNTGSYNWMIPSDLPVGNDYRVSVQNPDYLPFIDQSDQPFEILADRADSGVTVLRAANQEKVYKIISGKKLWIPSAEALLNQALTWESVRQVSTSEIDRYSRVKLIRLLGDSRVYYLTESGLKRHIPSQEAFLAYGNKWEDVVVATVGSEISYFPDNDLIKLENGGGKIYKLENGAKRWIKTSAAFNRLGFDWSKVAPVNQTEFDSYPTGTAIE